MLNWGTSKSLGIDYPNEFYTPETLVHVISVFIGAVGPPV